MPKISLKAFEEANNLQTKTAVFVDAVNNITTKTVDDVKKMVPVIISHYNNDLVIMGKRSLVVDLNRIDLEDNIDVIKYKLTALVNAITTLVGNPNGVAKTGHAIKMCIAHQRKAVLIKVIDNAIKQGSLDEGELIVARDLKSKYLSVIQSIEVSILSTYAAGIGRKEIDEYCEIDETCTSIKSYRKWGN